LDGHEDPRTSFRRDPTRVGGIAVVEASLPALVNRVYDMRMNARIQQMALSLGGTVSYLEGSQPAATPPDPAAWEYWTRSVSDR
jgi:hypothetical protein